MNTHALLRTLVAPALLALVGLMAAAQPAVAPASAKQPHAAPYQAPLGAPFFLLTDSSFASTDEARVRLEIAPGDMGLLDETGGVDIAVYRVADPLAFLRRQKNLHRIELAAAPRPEGLSNVLSFLWDGAWRKARSMWQGLFDPGLRTSVTEQAPQLKVHPDRTKPTPYVHQPAFQAPRGLQATQRFRYPVQRAKPIAPPKDLVLPGSSSDFIPTVPGNVYIPLGKQKPGLHVVEAAVGKHRALALLFVGDTVAVSKTSREQMLVWVAERRGGKPAPDAQVVWSDLQGVLGSGKANADGVATFRRPVPETSYVFGADAAGGVFVTENFYYDSEIYNNKLYAVTDRPLYRPGDEVNVLLVGREFTGARSSRPMATTTVALTVIDAQGTPVFSDNVAYQPARGGATRFTLPTQAPAGGYEIRMTRGDDEYSAAFRVAQYVKPHFEILVEPDQPAWKTGEPVTGRIRLAYPDGKPVAKAVLGLSARAQVLTMVDGDLAYGGAFPLQIDNAQELVTDEKGFARFKLPPAQEPSRLVLTVLATDGAIQRVRATQQLLIERAASAYVLRPERQFAMPKETVGWRFTPVDGTAGGPPVRWVALHQGTRTRTEGSLGSGASTMRLQLERPGAYTIELRDAKEQLVAAAPFFVAGGELKPPQGTVEIVFDKPRYRAGDTARALITFPDAVDDALLTLERDSVERYGRLAAPGRVGQVRKLNDRQWEARLAVSRAFAPNITLSVAYVKGHDFGFQNAGIAVEQPALQLSLKTDKPVYQPGETVTVEIQALADGVGVPASVSLGAVDEMVYVLQAEIAPPIHEFFYHPRRNNVRTHSSLAFISYDEASAPAGQERPRSRGTQERGIKLLERPRRDERDTAFWSAHIQTDALGRARVSFTVPDALTRWRLTARGFAQGKADGLVGEKRAWFQSDKPVYAKWTSPDWARVGDRARVSLAVFNQEQQAREVQVDLRGAGPALSRSVKLQPGANFVSFELQGLREPGLLDVQIAHGSQVLDRLQTRFGVLPVEWASMRETLVPVAPGQSQVNLALPADATGLKLRALGEGSASWSHVADALVEYPYGCVEQTASRLLPLALALRALPGADQPSSPLRQQLYAGRLRLASMAGPNAVFGWWGAGTQHSALLSAYAYYADFQATQTLGMTLPPAHWEQLLQIYGKEHRAESPGQRALALWMMREIGLPVTTYTRGLLEEFQAQARTAASAAPAGRDSWVFGDQAPQHALGLVIAAQLAKAENLTWPASLVQPLERSRATLTQSRQLLPQAALALAGAANADAVAQALQAAAETDPTFDRAIALAWLAKATGLRGAPRELALQPGAGWQAFKTPTGSDQWLWTGAGAAPNMIAMAQPAAQAFTISARYESHQRSGVALPAGVERQLFRLERRGKGWDPVPVRAGEPLSTTALYLDQFTVKSERPLRFAILEAALPPGAFLEPSTWGVTLLQKGKEQPLERAVGESTRTGYTVPFDAVQGAKTVRHLVRFAQKGQFALPASRLWRMYQPEAQAYEAGPAAQQWVVQ